MAKIEIYSSRSCAYCMRAKQLLTNKGVDYQEFMIDQDADAFEQMSKRTNGARTVPQIFIDDNLIGGYDDLAALDQKGELDQLVL